MGAGELQHDNWHRAVTSIANRNKIGPRRWGMRVTIYGTASDDADYLLSYNLNSTDLNDNANWLKSSNAGSVLPGGALNELQKNGGGFFAGCGTFSSVDGSIVMGFGTVPGFERTITALVGGELGPLTLDSAIVNSTAGRLAFFSNPDMSLINGNGFAFFADGTPPDAQAADQPGFLMYSNSGFPEFMANDGTVISLSGPVLVEQTVNDSATGFYVGDNTTAAAARLEIAAGSTVAGTAPIKLHSGPLLTTPVVGGIEFLTDKLQFTITTGAARKEITLNDSALGTTGNVPFTTTNGRLKTNASFNFNETILRLNLGSTGIYEKQSGSSIFIGRNAGGAAGSSTGNHNTGLGEQVLLTISTGDGNTAIGNGVLASVSTTNNNTAIGYIAMANGTGCVDNTVLGKSAGNALSGASNNVLIGLGAGSNITSGSQNVIFGYNISAQSATGSNQLSIANAIFGTGNSATGTSVSTGNIGIYVTSPTGRLHLPAGTATANTAPLKFTSGVNLTTGEAGAMEYDGTNLFFTRTGTTRESVLVGNSGATAPTTTAAGTVTNRYGGATNFLGDPNSWASVVIGGTTYKIPLYT